MAASTAEIAVVARLKESPAVCPRITPQSNTPDAPLPFQVVTRVGAVGTTRLSGSRVALQATTVEVATYAATQAEAIALAKAARDRLTPTGSAWRNLADGVQGCFYQDGSEEIAPDPAQDTPRVVRDTYLVWHFPT